MAALSDFFEYDNTTGTVRVIPAVANLKAVKFILNRDRTKTKEVANAELSYVFFMLSKKHYHGVSEKVKPAKIRDRVGLPDTWEPDDKVLSVMEMFALDTMSTAEIVYRSTLETLLTTFRVLDGLRGSTELLLTKIHDATTGTAKLSAADAELGRELVKELKEDILFIIKASKDLPGSIQTVEDALKKVRAEESDSRMQAGKEANSYERNPNRWKGSSGI